MIRIVKGELSNDLILTLTEKQTLTNPYFLFYLTHDMTGASASFISEDISDYPDRYNEFIVSEKSNPDRTAGEVELIHDGSYTYKVYEQISSTNLLPELATNQSPLEIGKLKVENPFTYNKYDDQSKEYNSYVD